VSDLIINPGTGVLYMKVGTHANEPLEEIFERKRKEIRHAGMAFWGYGGGTCHPETMVQPFAKSFERKGHVIRLVMEPMDSRHFAEQIAADEFSIDGTNWERVPAGINVLGSRFALVIKNLEKVDLKLPLSRTMVALGNSTGALGSRYIKGRVDKACLEVTGTCEGLSGEEELLVRPIKLVADVIKPYAVYVRNRS
jgi:hypothetical protein